MENLLALKSGHFDHGAVSLVVEIGRERDRHVGRIAQLGQPHLPEAVVEPPLHGTTYEMPAAIRGPGRYDLLHALSAGHVYQILQAYALLGLTVALHAREIGLATAPEEQVLARPVHLLFLG